MTLYLMRTNERMYSDENIRSMKGNLTYKFKQTSDFKVFKKFLLFFYFTKLFETFINKYKMINTFVKSIHTYVHMYEYIIIKKRKTK